MYKFVETHMSCSMCLIIVLPHPRFPFHADDGYSQQHRQRQHADHPHVVNLVNHQTVVMLQHQKIYCQQTVLFVLFLNKDSK